MATPRPKTIDECEWFPLSETKKNSLKVKKVKKVNKGGSTGHGFRAIRGLVSKKKRRFQQNGYDLDLSYITDQIIAMGFPSSKGEGMYRNPMTEVQRFFKERHPDHYEIVNLCSERNYESNKFDKVELFPFDDQYLSQFNLLSSSNPPAFDLIPKFCFHLSSYIGKDSRNVSAIHCKAGKGRTGTLISAWMVYAKIFPTAEEAMTFFAIARTHDSKGVTIPSQRRYVNYTEQWVRNGPWKPTVTRLKKIVFNQTPNFSRGGCNAFFVISLGKKKIYKSKPVKFQKGHGPCEFTLDEELDLQDDVKVQFYHQGKTNREKMLHFWFHSSFLPTNNTLTLKKHEIDKAVKDKGCKHFKPEFTLEATFSPPKSGVKKSIATLREIDFADSDPESDTDEEEELPVNTSIPPPLDGGSDIPPMPTPEAPTSTATSVPPTPLSEG